MVNSCGLRPTISWSFYLVYAQIGFFVSFFYIIECKEKIMIFRCQEQYNSNIMNKEQVQQVYQVVDSISFSRPKKNINRDFSDGVMMAEMINYYNPKIIQLHNYPPANSLTKKIQNWNTLNSKVFKKMGINLTKQQVQDAANGVVGFIQQFLFHIINKYENTDHQSRVVDKLKESSQRTIKNEQPETPAKSKEGKDPKENKQNRYNENTAKKSASKPYNEQATIQIIDLVVKIDQATAHLHRLKQMSKAKDQIIKNLQQKVQKLIYS